MRRLHAPVPKICDQCDAHECDNADLPCYLRKGKMKQWTCEELSVFEQEKIDRKCAEKNFFTTCNDNLWEVW